jgi:hypothetical protein
VKGRDLRRRAARRRALLALLQNRPKPQAEPGTPMVVSVRAMPQEEFVKRYPDHKEPL